MAGTEEIVVVAEDEDVVVIGVDEGEAGIEAEEGIEAGGVEGQAGVETVNPCWATGWTLCSARSARAWTRRV